MWGIDQLCNWFSICAIFISWLLTIFYASDVYAELSDEDAELSLDLRDLEELPLLNLLIILLIVIENNHNFILNQFR